MIRAAVLCEGAPVYESPNFSHVVSRDRFSYLVASSLRGMPGGKVSDAQPSMFAANLNNSATPAITETLLQEVL